MTETAEAAAQLSRETQVATRRLLADHAAAAGPFAIPTTKWRVKLYRLESSVWIDEGTGMCWGAVVDSTNEAYLIVEDETAESVKLLQAKVVGAVTYQKQDTLIIWNEPGANADLALSFQEAAGCVSLCDFLLYVHQHLEPDVALSVSVNQSETSESVTETVKLPPLPTADNIIEVIEAIVTSAASQFGRDSLMVYFEHHRFLQCLTDLFAELESGSNSELDAAKRLNTLFQLSRLVKVIFSVGEGLLIDSMLDSTHFESILGMLEYDPSFGKRKANYRHYYNTETRFKEVVPIPDGLVLEKIRRTFRLQLLKDVVLARSLDDETFGLVSTLIYVNQMEVIMALQSSAEFSSALFGLFEAGKGASAKEKADGLRFIHHLMTTTKQFPAQQRVQLYVHMLDTGLIDALAYGLESSNPDDALRGLALESLSCVLEFDSSIVKTSTALILQPLMSVLYCSEPILEKATSQSSPKPDSDRDPEQDQDQDQDQEKVKDQGQDQDEDRNYDNGKENHRSRSRSSRAVRMQIFEAVKLLLHNAFNEGLFSEYAREVFRAATLFPKEAVSETALDILEFCFTVDSAETSEIVSELDLWRGLVVPLMHQLTEETALDSPSLPSSPNSCALLSLIRLVRRALNLPQLDLAERQARFIAGYGVLSFLLEQLVALGNVNTAVHSSILGLLRFVVLGSERQSTYLCSWMVRNCSSLLSRLGYVPFLTDLVAIEDDTEEDEGSRISSRKRPIEEEPFQRRTSQRLRLSDPAEFIGPDTSFESSPISGPVDELDSELREFEHIDRFNTPPPSGGSPRSPVGKLNLPAASAALRRPASAPPRNGSPTPVGGQSSSPGKTDNSGASSPLGSDAPRAKSTGGSRFRLRKTFAQAKKRLLPQNSGSKDPAVSPSR